MLGCLRIPLTAKNASVDETTIAALDDSPDPAGTVPVTSMSMGTGDDSGSFSLGLKYYLNSPTTAVKCIGDRGVGAACIS